MLRKIRLALALACFIPLTLLFLDFTGTLHAWFGWMAKVQLLPAILAVNVAVIVLLTLTSLLFGRIYCSVICPLGVFQDVISWIAGKRNKYRFSYSSEKVWLRYPIMVMFIAALLFGVSAIVNLLEPYSIYGRIASNLLAPIYQMGNNLLAFFAERVNSYAFYSVDIWIKSAGVLSVAIISLAVVGVLSWRYGRSYCNTICPVGTFLGLVSRFSIYKIRIDNSKCNNCGLCERSCKSSCISSKEHSIDFTRCVACFSCIDKCRHSAITYAPRFTCAKSVPKVNEIEGNENATDSSRRKFLSILALFTVSTALNAQQKKVDGGLAIIEDKQQPNRKAPVTPPGSHSARNFNRHCTACQLCVSVCPNQVLRPSGDITTLLQPEMTYERGFCRPECTKCSEVCPAGAIEPITVAEKSSLQIGHAVWIEKNCVVLTDKVECGNCARHCPAGAITMVERLPKGPVSQKIPVVNVERCIGCGACEYLCPSRPFSAIYVEGHAMHRMV